MTTFVLVMPPLTAWLSPFISSKLLTWSPPGVFQTPCKGTSGPEQSRALFFPSSLWVLLLPSISRTCGLHPTAMVS